MGWKSTCLFLLFITNYIEGQLYYELGKGCTSSQDSSTGRCIVTINCNNVIQYIDTTFSSVSCLNNYYGYRSYDGSYDIILNFKNMDLNEIMFKQILPQYMPRKKVKKIEMDNFEMTTIPNQILNFDEITHFEITNSALETIDLSMFHNKHNLLFINVSNNRISLLENDNIGTSSMHSLELIDLSFNFIQTLPNNYFYRFPNLLHLNLSYNYIDHFEILTFEGLSLLQTLYLSHNKLVNIDHSFARFANLQELILDHNQIVSLKEPNFNVMTQLQKLNLSANEISEIEDTTFQTLIALHSLDLSHNDIPLLSKNTFQRNDNLQVLIISDNNIKNIAKGIFSAMNLTQFRINNNNISGIVDKGIFQGIRESEFDLSRNKIEILESDVFNSFGSELKYLNLSQNNIHIISNSTFLSADYIISLDISYNSLEIIDGYLKILTEIKYLNISHNNLTRLFKNSFENLGSLNTLDLSFNCIKFIEDGSFNDLRSLKTLVLNNNHFENSFTSHTLRGTIALVNIFVMNIEGTINFDKYAFSDMRDLKVINSSFSGLTTIDHDAFNDTGSIEILDFSHNLLEYFDVDKNSIPRIKELYLHYNRIQNITFDMFDGLIALVKLTLAFNNIIQVEDDCFSSLTTLGFLDLSNNEMLMINGSQVENITSLYSLSLRRIKTSINFRLVTASSVKILGMSQCNINDIHSVSIHNLKNVTDLDLSSNKITHVDRHSFQTMPVLSSLDISDNLIKYIQPGTFMNTKLIKNINLYKNDISILQYGVFDGLQNLEILNLSSNSLKTFEANLFHDSHEIVTIALDDNNIEKINLDNFEGKNIREISLGGNFINCEVFINLKNHEYSFKITAQTLDYHSENVNGITCKTFFNNSYVSKQSNDTILPNITAAFDSLANAMNMFRTAIEQVASNNIVNSNESKTEELDGVLKTINKLVKLYNDSQSLTNDLLQRMIENNGRQTQPIQVHNETSEVRTNINTPVYVTLGCLVVLCCALIFLSYTYFKWKSRIVDVNNFSSNRHLANEMEME